MGHGEDLVPGLQVALPHQTIIVGHVGPTTGPPNPGTILEGGDLGEVFLEVPGLPDLPYPALRLLHGFTFTR